MKYVDSGNGKIPLISLIAILSISLTVNLPGLAVSPLLGKLQTVFPHVTELESQLLTILPNFVIIPFILFSGKICTPRNQMTVLLVGLMIYIASGVLFMLADSMAMLIVLSCLLGVGCGLIIPLAASLIAVNFTGGARTCQLGMKSGLSNFTVIFATIFVGWIASKGWHLAFLVYLVPLVPLCLMPFMTSRYIAGHRIDGGAEPATPATAEAATTEAQPPRFNFQGWRAVAILSGVIGLYIALTYGTEAISYYLPFTMEHYSMSTGQVGMATSMYYLGATFAGFTLTRFINAFDRATPYIAIAMCVVGLYAIGWLHTYWLILAAVFVMGYGYGIMQPVIYDKTAHIAQSPARANKFFAYTLTGNYIAIAIVPFVVDMFARMFHSASVDFAYILNGSLLLLVLGVAFLRSRSFVFYVTRRSH